MNATTAVGIVGVLAIGGIVAAILLQPGGPPRPATQAEKDRAFLEAVGAERIPIAAPSAPQVEAVVEHQAAAPSPEVASPRRLDTVDNVVRDALNLMDGGLYADAQRKISQDPEALAVLKAKPDVARAALAVKAANAFERKRDTPNAIAARSLAATLGDIEQTNLIAALEKKQALAEIEQRISEATKNKDWRTVRDGHIKAALLSGKPRKSQIEQATRRLDAAEKQAAYGTAVLRMESGSSGAGMSMRAQQGEYRKCVGYQCGREDDAKFLLLYVSLSNQDQTPKTVSSLGFTITSCGQESPISDASFSVSPTFPSVTIAPGNIAAGWLVFFVSNKCSHTLRYRPMWDSGEIVLPVTGK